MTIKKRYKEWYYTSFFCFTNSLFDYSFNYKIFLNYLDLGEEGSEISSFNIVYVNLLKKSWIKICNSQTIVFNMLSIIDIR